MRNLKITTIKLHKVIFGKNKVVTELRIVIHNGTFF